MKMLIILLFATFLASCKTMEPRPVAHIKYFQKKCSVYCFDYPSLKIVEDRYCGDDFESNENLPVYECDGIIGPFITDYAEYLKPEAKFNIRECKDAMESK